MSAVSSPPWTPSWHWRHWSGEMTPSSYIPLRYSYNNNIKDLTAMKVMVDLPDSNITEYVDIDRNGISKGLVIYQF